LTVRAVHFYTEKMYFLEDLDEEEYEIAIKVVIVGNGAVGKSSMIQRYCKGIFTRNYKKTIGVDFLEKHITASGEDVRLMLWDTAGQEEFDAITKAYYRGAQACVIAFSTTDHASFEAVKKWKRKVEDECGHVPMVLVQNKIDLLHESQIDSHEVEKFARNTGLKLFRTSVKENLNIGRVFQHLAECHIESVSRWSDESADEFSQPILQIGHHHRDQQSRDHVRVRFANEHELNDNQPKGIALYHRGFKLNGYTQHSGSKQHNGGLRVSNGVSNGKNGKNDHRIILNPFKWSLNSNNKSRSSSVTNGESAHSQQQKNAGNGGGVNFYAHHPRYYHQHQIHHHQPHQAQQKPACRLA